MDPIAFIRQTINILSDIFVMLIFLRIILSWFPHEAFGLNRFLQQTTEPILKPIRRMLPSMGMFDISPMVAIFLIQIVRNIINSLL